MLPVFNVNAQTVRPLTGSEKALGLPRVQRLEEKSQGCPLKPALDEYVPEEEKEPSGLYWLGKDAGGQPKIYFDDPGPDADALDAKNSEEGTPGLEGPEQSKIAKKLEEKGRKGENFVGNTDQVDREIEKLKKRQTELKQRLNAETDGVKIKDLKRQLAQVERELSQKDNDIYRKRHMKIMQLP